MFSKKNKQPADLEVFVIYDSKVEAYENPHFAVNQHDLTRQVVNMFKDPAQGQNKYLLNAEDYAIFKIAEYSRKTGQLEAHPPQHVANMIDLRTVAKRDMGIALT